MSGGIGGGTENFGKSYGKKQENHSIMQCCISLMERLENLMRVATVGRKVVRYDKDWVELGGWIVKTL